MKLLNDMFFIVSTENEKESGTVYGVKLNPEHFIYKLHFPGNPITPGVCLIQMTQEILEQQFRRAFCLVEISNVKFLQTLIPAADAVIFFRFGKITLTDEGCKVQLSIADTEQAYAKLSLRYGYERI
jgi:3-hydroxyacyl-[acyl-carrier-protein] dehydratase